VYCPIQVVKDSDLISPGPVTVNDAVLMYYDGNTASNDFTCRPVLRDSNGAQTWGPLQATPAGKSPGGYNQLIWYDPFVGQNLALSNYKQHGLYFACVMPATGTGGNSIIFMQKATLAYQGQ
jgi:hypothetical protein